MQANYHQSNLSDSETEDFQIRRLGRELDENNFDDISEHSSDDIDSSEEEETTSPLQKQMKKQMKKE